MQHINNAKRIRSLIKSFIILIAFNYKESKYYARVNLL